MSERPRMRMNNIILVDDEPDVIFAVKTALEENENFKVHAFNDAESALVAFKPGHYDLAILDIRMPIMNGFQLCKKLREIDKNLKICFLTAADLTHLHEVDSDVINDLGKECFINKPVDTTDLMDRLGVIMAYS